MIRLILLALVLAAGAGAADAQAETAAATAGPSRDLARMAGSVADLPVLHDGRIKPFASVARHLLLSVSGRGSVPVEGGQPLSPTAWLLEGVADRAAATARPAVKLRNPEVAEALGLAERPGLRYTIDEVIAGLMAHRDQIAPLFQRDRKQLGPAEMQVVELGENLAKVFTAMDPDGLALIPGPEAHREQWSPRNQVAGPDPLQAAAILAWTDLLRAVAAGDAAAVEAQAAVLRGALSPVSDPARLAAEVVYHRASPFAWSLGLDLAAIVLLGIGLMTRSRLPYRLAIAALASGTALHLAGIAARIWIMERPPVATLYESVVFVGAVAAVLGLLLEAFRRRGDGAFVGAALAAILHAVALGYADDGDTMGMLVAVLNSNFWLTIHVITITAGYGCTLVAGLAAHVALAARALRPLDADTHRGHDRALVGLSLVSLLFTLFGTILGGIWADQSWGRFWGWDPKENGALLIVLWLLMLLHLRLAGTAGPRGFAAGLILGNIVVAAAWFGVNMLNVGLHSYGFTPGVLWGLIGTTAAEVAAASLLWTAATARQRARPGQA